jgi:uncharacterized protein YtpQ (UPF0354 family)
MDDNLRSFLNKEETKSRINSKNERQKGLINLAIAKIVIKFENKATETLPIILYFDAGEIEAEELCKDISL